MTAGWATCSLFQPAPRRLRLAARWPAPPPDTVATNLVLRPIRSLTPTARSSGFGTVYEALENRVSGTTWAPLSGAVGLAALMLAGAMGANLLVGVELNKERIQLAQLGLARSVRSKTVGMSAKLKELTGGRGFEKAIDCSGHPDGRAAAPRVNGARSPWWARADAFPQHQPGTSSTTKRPSMAPGDLTSIWRMDAVERLVRWACTPRNWSPIASPSTRPGEAYRLMASEPKWPSSSMKK